MKYVLLLLLPFGSFAQGYFNVEGTAIALNSEIMGGPIFSFGGILKDKQGNGGLMIGGGTGVIIESADNAFFPLFLELGYMNRRKKFFPQITARIGTALSDNGTSGLYTTFRAGLAWQVGIARFTPFGGVVVIGNPATAAATFGLSVILHKKGKRD